MGRLTRYARWTLPALALGALLAGRAPAAPATPQARDLDAEFLASAPAPPQAVAVCQIDTGVSATPDLGDAVVARLNALGAAQVDDAAAPEGHGTLVAEMIAGPLGIWPGARLVSVRAVGADGGSSYWSTYARGIYACLGSGQPVRVINLSVADTPAAPGELTLLAGAVRAALGSGVSVVVAAGNGSGAPLQTPADLPGVVPVAAAGPEGALCGYSSQAPGILSAPGCPVSWVNLDGSPGAGDGGTSLAAPQVAAVLAALRAYRPDLMREQAEALVRQSARAGGAGSLRVDAAAAFRAAGLGALVTGAPPPAERSPTVASGPPVAPSGRPRTPEPHIKLSVRRGVACASAALRAGERLVWAGHRARRLSPRTLVIPLGPSPAVIWISAAARGQLPARVVPTRLPARGRDQALAVAAIPERPC